MRFTAVLATSASLITLGYATDPLAFTSWPADIAAGKPVTLTWAGGAPDQPVTLTLRKGAAGNLEDVETITAQAKDGKFTWTPGANIKEGQNYAFMLSQGAENNYSSLLKAAAPAPGIEKSMETQASTGTTAAATETGASTTAPHPTGTTGATRSSATGATLTSMTTGSSSHSVSASTSASASTSDSSSSSSRPLISSTPSGTPSSSSPVSTEVVTNSVAAEPSITGQSRKAKQTSSIDENTASAPQFSLGLALGAIAAFVFGF
ncbi:hypothetical protein N7468_005927 [Penicillium chermesinum]|uniref:Yeast cell wall synthesis Kre9/Knh1-like N-terminal domain-containing protein n=1 Tax=Penicillium chermesinum TaxID=63820 RepID=A0A9W9TNE8_9EURO|nr:uncharacterized protein N7468_005927 [Penicillium chermesinum]KAJ5232971.1 hypothetical protein N7468_005927 [Penicillium chermesinum]KAJ6172619.1 hypothetical protein N7470_001686 [Penicillium chermesinum]